MASLRERFQAPCAAHAADFERLRQALADAEASYDRNYTYRDPRKMLRDTIYQLWRDCQDCRAATLTAAREYAANQGQQAKVKLPKRQPRCRQCGRYGYYREPHTHNAEGGFVFSIPGPPVPGPGFGVTSRHFVGWQA